MWGFGDKELGFRVPGSSPSPRPSKGLVFGETRGALGRGDRSQNGTGRRIKGNTRKGQAGPCSARLTNGLSPGDPDSRFLRCPIGHVRRG